jgi:hypothetical protein
MRRRILMAISNPGAVEVTHGEGASLIEGDPEIAGRPFA